MKGKLDETELRNVLVQNNVDPNNYQIQKEIRAASLGANNTKHLVSNIAKAIDQYLKLFIIN